MRDGYPKECLLWKVIGVLLDFSICSSQSDHSGTLRTGSARVRAIIDGRGLSRSHGRLYMAQIAV